MTTRHHHRIAAILTLAFVLSASLRAEETTAGPPFVDGDVVCFVGDSITHDGRWHRAIADYYLTRFPERAIRYVNCGISGDTARGALARLDSDVLARKPTVVVIMLGMNDCGRTAYSAANDKQPGIQAVRDKALSSYRDNMTQIVARVRSAGVPRVILVTPSPFEQTATIATENLPGANDALGRCGDIVRELARATSSGFVDFHGPMTAIDLRLQQKDPAATIVGPDRVHPGSSGHQVMAWLFLTAQGAPRAVSRVVLDADKRTLVSCVGASVDALAWDGTGARFTVNERSLPWPLNPDCADARQWSSLEDDLDREDLLVAGLAEGTYELSIDGKPVGRYGEHELSNGINLAFAKDAPQCQQALHALMLSNQRHEVELQLRNVDYIDITWLLPDQAISAPSPTPGPSSDDLRARLVALADKKSGSKAWKDKIVNEYLASKPIVPELEAQILTMTKQMRDTVQPHPHAYKLQKLAP